MQRASKDKRKRKKVKENSGTKTTRASVNSGLTKHKRNLLRSLDNWAKSTEENMTDGITQHVVKALTTAGHLHMLEYILD